MKIMCEWLSCGEWCDVYLVCGGHAFSAHRAVLASVSSFLRQIFLSCPTEETPTLIVLPEFDLEIMSSVLYYIYNGEIVIQKNQFKTFLDTINAMQIYVDSKYLPKNNNLIQKEFDNMGLCQETVVTKSVTSECSNDERNDYVNLKRETNFRSVVNNMRYSLNHTDSTKDKRESQSSVRESKCSRHSGYLKSQWHGRQRQPFSRNLLIETYSTNGNGVAGGVLAITNEDYLKPKSVLLTNANIEDLGAHALSNKSRKKILTTLFEREQQNIKTFDEKRDITNMYNINRCQNNMNKNRLDTKMHFGNSSSILGNAKNNVAKSEKLSLQQLKESLGQTSKNNSQTPINLKLLECNTRSKKDVKRHTKCGGNITKMAIFNEVLQSPWRPRLPNDYVPFCRKYCDLNLRPQSEDNTQQLLNDQEINSTTSGELNPNTSTKNDSTKRNSDLRFKCNYCEQVFSDPGVFDVHVKQHAGSRYTCLECHKTFSQLRNYKYHMSVHRGTKEFATTCPVCGKYFNDKGYLSSHMKIHRNRKEYKCSLCPKSFNQRVAYNMHFRIHTGIKPHACDECGKAFSRKMLLKQHKRTHSGERPYSCTHCDRRFADRSNMTLHLRLHSGVKPFTCSLCSKSFTKKHHLKSHLNFHTGVKPYSCPLCKLGFTQSSNMRTHFKKCNVSQCTENNDVNKTIQ